MKKIIILFIVLGLGLTYSCKKDPKDPVLDMNQTANPGITNPQDGSTYVLLKDEAENLINFTWTATSYNLTDLESTKYLLQMDYADSNFAKPIELTATTTLSYEITVGALNNKLLSVMGAIPDEATNIAFRVVSYINNETTYSTVYSGTNTSSITPYGEVVHVKPIYLLGSATTIEWDNMLALETTHIGEGKFAIVETLKSGADMFIKFISVRGQWAPQWGTDETGVWDSGPLAYRPDETVPDPVAIPAPDTDGDYYILADTSNLTYEVSATSAQLFLVGDATDAGWDNTAGLPFTKVSPGIFTITTNLKAEGGMKFLEVSGEWAPQWGTDEAGAWDIGPLVYRPTESVPDPANIPAPSTAGTYVIELNLITMEYKIASQ